MLTAQEEARIMAKIRKDSYGITLEQMKQYFKKHQHAREIGDKKNDGKNRVPSHLHQFPLRMWAADLRAV